MLQACVGKHIGRVLCLRHKSEFLGNTSKGFGNTSKGFVSQTYYSILGKPIEEVYVSGIYLILVKPIKEFYVSCLTKKSHLNFVQKSVYSTLSFQKFEFSRQNIFKYSHAKIEKSPQLPRTLLYVVSLSRLYNIHRFT